MPTVVKASRLVLVCTVPTVNVVGSVRSALLRLLQLGDVVGA